MKKEINKKLKLVEDLANELFAKDEISIIGHRTLKGKGWVFEWDNAKSRMGCSKYTKKIISMSKPLAQVNSDEENVDTLLHEIAHALCPFPGHNKVWQNLCLDIGCSDSITPKTYIDTKKKWKGVCPSCGCETFTHRRKNISCGNCSKTYDEKYKFKWFTNDGSEVEQSLTYKWKSVCQKCGNIVFSNTRGDFSCGKCTKTYDEKYKLEWDINE